MNRVISFVLLSIAALSAYSQNLAINPGFETWQKINKPAGWTTALSCLKDSLVIYSGSYSCRQATTSESKELGQLIPVSPEKLYRISFKYRNETAMTGNGCRIWSNWNDADGNSITDDISLPFLHSGYFKSDKWEEYSVEVTSPANAAFLNLILRTLPNSVTYWDEIIFEVSVPTGKSDIESDNILIYPNPAHNYLTINNIQCIQHIDIQTITGIRIWSHKITGEKNLMIPIYGFKDGIYIICIYSQDKLFTKKFIKVSD